MTTHLVLLAALTASEPLWDGPKEIEGYGYDAVVASGSPALAPEPPSPPIPPLPPVPPMSDEDPIAQRLFPPEAIMQRQKQIGITEKQRNAIVAEVQKFQTEIVPLQWQLQAATEDLAQLLDSKSVDEGKTLAQADKVMELEHKVKRSHLGLLIRLRNLLTEEQRQKLRHHYEYE